MARSAFVRARGVDMSIHIAVTMRMGAQSQTSTPAPPNASARDSSETNPRAGPTDETSRAGSAGTLTIYSARTINKLPYPIKYPPFQRYARFAAKSPRDRGN